MRTIKFRAWHKVDKMLYFGDCDFHMTMDGSWYSSCDKDPLVKLNKAGFIFMQYTGLKDKRNREIFEGDIVKCDDAGNREVFFTDASYFTKNKFRGKKSVHFLTDDPKYYEVIGNIYENPELLK